MDRSTKLNVVIPHRGYIAPLKMMGPVVHPISVEKGIIAKILLSGAPVQTMVGGKYNTLTLDNLADASVAKTLPKPSAPVQPVVKTGSANAKLTTIPEFTFNDDGTVNEQDIEWGKYTSSTKKAIRVAIKEANTLAAEKAALDAANADSTPEEDPTDTEPASAVPDTE